MIILRIKVISVDTCSTTFKLGVYGGEEASRSSGPNYHLSSEPLVALRARNWDQGEPASQWRSLPPRGVQRCVFGLKSVQRIISGCE
jgi:hypothetical protein